MVLIVCFSKIQIGFNFLVLAHPGSPGQRTVKRVCVRVCVCVCVSHIVCFVSEHTHPFNGPFSRTTRVIWYQKG